MSIKLTHTLLKRLAALNAFPIPDDELVFFGFRGLMPVSDSPTTLREAHAVQLADVTYKTLRCTLGQWLPSKGKLRTFAGSTVPYIGAVERGIDRGGHGVNQLLTGYYRDFRKGKHSMSKAKYRHEAFRGDIVQPVRRTADDLDFDTLDRVEIRGGVFDNIHAAWCGGLDKAFSSNGCQVIYGYPKTDGGRRANKPNLGHWADFHKHAYALSQTSFAYQLLNGRDLAFVAANAERKIPVRLRYGSQGDLVEEVQQKLQAAEFYEGLIDGDFGRRTLRAVLDYQEVEFGPTGDDGIVGPLTAAALDVTWPQI